MDSLNAGVSVIATAHASNLEELLRRRQIARLLTEGAFQKIVFLKAQTSPLKWRGCLTGRRSMLKLIGIGLMIAATTMVGLNMSASLSKRVSELEASLVLLEKMQTYLRYEQTPTDELIEKLATLELFGSLRFLTECRRDMGKGTPFPQAWRAGVNRAKGAMHLWLGQGFGGGAWNIPDYRHVRRPGADQRLGRHPGYASGQPTGSTAKKRYLWQAVSFPGGFVRGGNRNLLALIPSGRTALIKKAGNEKHGG